MSEQVEVLVYCPNMDCGMPADIEAMGMLHSTDGPVAMSRVRCVAGHVYTMPALDLEVMYV